MSSRLSRAGRSVRYPFETGSMAAAEPILYLTLGSGKPVLVRRLVAGSKSTVSSCQADTVWSKETGGSPTAGTAVTGIVMDGDPTGPTVTVKVGVTGATFDLSADIEREPWASLYGYRFVPQAADDWVYLDAGAGNKWAWRLATIPSTAFIVSGELEVLELIP